MRLELTAEEVEALKYTLEDITEVYEDTDECDCDSEEEYNHIQNVACMLRQIYTKLN